MRKGILRGLACSLSVVLALGCALVLGACSSGPSAEELIREDITTSLDQIKNMDDATMSELMETLDTSALEPYGVDGTELVKSLLGGFDYSIDSVSVDGDTATASVSVTCKSATTFSTDLQAALQELLDDPDLMELATDEESLNERMGQIIMETLDGVEPETKTLELTYTQTDGEWALDESSAAEVAQIFV